LNRWIDSWITKLTVSLLSLHLFPTPLFWLPLLYVSYSLARACVMCNTVYSVMICGFPYHVLRSLLSTLTLTLTLLLSSRSHTNNTNNNGMNMGSMMVNGDIIDTSDTALITRIAFGSCTSTRDGLQQPIFTSIAATWPDVWLWLGDSIYADTKISAVAWVPTSPAIMRDKYTVQKSLAEYTSLRHRVRYVHGIWDDHDYGVNDGMYVIVLGPIIHHYAWPCMDHDDHQLSFDCS
jgi:hypothetical protein